MLRYWALKACTPRHSGKADYKAINAWRRESQCILNFWIASRRFLILGPALLAKLIATNAVGAAKEHDSGVAQRRDHAVLNRSNGGVQPLKTDQVTSAL